MTEERLFSTIPAFRRGAVKVALAANDAFAGPLSVALASIYAHKAPEREMDILIMESDISDAHKAALEQQASAHAGIRLHFYRAAELVRGYRLTAHGHITGETFYRFLIQDLFPDDEKVLYLDGDIVACADICTLFDEPVEGYMLAAVRDYDFIGQANNPFDPGREYATEVLGLACPENYFQAGVLLMNLNAMRSCHTMEEWLSLASVEYRFSDQDVLNRACEGKVRFLDPSWNVVTDCGGTRIDKVIAHAPETLRAEYITSRRMPRIIHYAGWQKPWHVRSMDLADAFWQYAPFSPLYGELTASLAASRGDAGNGSGAFRKVLDALFPPDTDRRRLMKRFRTITLPKLKKALQGKK